MTTGGMRIVGNKIVQGKTTPASRVTASNLHGRGRRAADRRPVAKLHRPADWDIQHGTRNGAAVQLMKQAIANLTEEDLVAIAAYVSSRAPSASTSRDTQIAGQLR